MTQRPYALSVDEIARELHINPETGLSPQEAEDRLRQNGHNEFAKEAKKSLAAKFLDQFKSVMILILLAAAVISGAVGVLHDEGIVDSLIILLIVVVNAVIGVAQENKAENALEALEQMAAPHCKAVRNGQIAVIPARDLAPGDVVVVETGDLVPADMRLVETVNLKIQESALTGESAPRDKNTEPLSGEVQLGDRDNMAFSSSTVTYGRGKGIVTATGMHTEVGKIAGMLQSVPDTKTPLQIRIDRLGKFLGVAAVAVCAVIFVAGFIEGRNVLDMFMIAVSLAAAAIPEGLPAVSTIVLAVGVQRLAKKNAIVRNLPSVETLGSASVICSDKTGTLTQNKMAVVAIAAGMERPVDVPERLNAEQSRFLTTMILPNDGKLTGKDGRWQTTGDPTETAFIDLGLRFGLNKTELERRHVRVAEVPFDSGRKMMSTVAKSAGDALTVYVKGGLEEVLARCTGVLDGGSVRPLTDKDRDTLLETNKALADQALRVLAGAFKTIDAVPAEIDSSTLENDLIYCGMAGMIDPPRAEVKDAVAVCRRAGIKPVMITGDHVTTASAIAGQLGILREGEEYMTGAELDKLSDDMLDKEAKVTSVYARVAPEHKVRIVKAFQKNKEIVAMTGDGVNDAPALKLADIGLAMGITGTDVSKGAADIILADDNFATIVTAVEEGRRIYDNILKAVQFMLSTNLGEILVIFTAIMLRWPTPLLPIQILWINLVTDSLPALALSVDPAEPDIMDRKPIPAEQGIMQPAYLARIILQGVMIAGLSLIAFTIGGKTDVTTARTMTFAVLGLSQITQVLNVRSSRHSAFRGIFSNRLLIGAIVIVAALMLIVLEVPYLHDFFHLSPITREHWFWIAVLSLAPLPLVELAKAAVRIVR